MASYTSSFFFKLENSNLSLKDIRQFGLVAKEGNNGFVEVSVSSQIINAERDLKHVESGKGFHERNHTEHNWNEYYEKLISFLIKGLKPETPPLMYLSSGSFGGCMDDYPIIKSYNTDGSYKKHRDDYSKDSKANQIFKEYYPELAEKGYYDSVGFVRDSDSDLISDEQKSYVKNIYNKIEDIEYERWLEKQESLTLESLSKKLIECYESVTGFNPSYEDKQKISIDVKFIKRYIAMYH